MAPETDELGVRELPLVRNPYAVYYDVAEERSASRTFAASPPCHRGAISDKKR